MPEPAPARILEGDIKADWLVLGGGAGGLSFARRLAELWPDDSIAVIEGMRVGYGTSGRNAGFILSHHSHDGIKNLDASKKSDRLFQTGRNYLREIVEHHQIRCNWSDWGQIYVSASPPGYAHLDNVANGFETLGIAHTAVDRDELERSPAPGFTKAARGSMAAPLCNPPR